MTFSHLFKRLVLVSSVMVGVALADAITPAAISNGGNDLRDLQLREIRDVLRGGRGGYIDLGFYYTPLTTQMPLESPYGEHEGFATKQHIAGFGSGEIGKGNHLGALLWFERQGWDGEDFFFFPKYNDFSLMRSVTTWGLTFTQQRLDMTIAGGMQHVNVEHVGDVYPDENDSLLYSWAEFRYGHASVQGSFHRKEWREMRISLDLESRAIYGGRSSGPLTYLPNFDVTLFNGGDEDDSLLVFWEQNLFQQRLYGEVAFNFPDKEFHSAALKYYPDPSRMVAFEATCLRRNVRSGKRDLLWGGAVEFPFIRVAYNSSYEYEHYFGAKGTWLVEFQFNLGTVDGFLFSRGATQSAPMESVKLDRKTREFPKEGGNKIQLPGSEKSSEPLTAKGVRHEVVGSSHSEGGK